MEGRTFGCESKRALPLGFLLVQEPRHVVSLCNVSQEFKLARGLNSPEQTRTMVGDSDAHL